MKMDGEVFPVEIHAREFHQDVKTLRIATFRNLTEQKKMQRKLADSEKKFRTLYRNAAAALYRTRISDGKMLSCNTAMAKMIGFDSIEECLKSGFLTADHYVDKDGRRRFLDRLKKKQTRQRFPFAYQTHRRNGRATASKFFINVPKVVGQ